MTFALYFQTVSWWFWFFESTICIVTLQLHGNVSEYMGTRSDFFKKMVPEYSGLGLLSFRQSQIFSSVSKFP